MISRNVKKEKPLRYKKEDYLGGTEEVVVVLSQSNFNPITDEDTWSEHYICFPDDLQTGTVLQNNEYIRSLGLKRLLIDEDSMQNFDYQIPIFIQNFGSHGWRISRHSVGNAVICLHKNAYGNNLSLADAEKEVEMFCEMLESYANGDYWDILFDGDGAYSSGGYYKEEDVADAIVETYPHDNVTIAYSESEEWMQYVAERVDELVRQKQRRL